jgi:hypothetical protein
MTMHFDWQDFAAIALVLAAVVYLVQRIWRRNAVSSRQQPAICPNCLAATQGRRCAIRAGRSKRP